MQERTCQGRGSAFPRGPRKSFPLRVLLARPILSCAHYFKRLLCRLKRCGLLKFGKNNSKGWNGTWLIQPCSKGLLVFKLGAIERKTAMATTTSESNRFRLAKQQVFMCITLFLYISLPSPHDPDVKMPNFMFYGGRKQATTHIFLSLLNLSEVPRNSIPGKFADNWHFQRFGINTTKFEKRNFILRVTFLLPSLSLMPKLANNYNGGRSEDPVTQLNHVTNFSSDVMLKSEKPLGTRLRLTFDAFFPSFLL